MKYTMPLEHERKLKAMFGLSQGGDEVLPADVIKRYWLSKRAADKIGQTFTDYHLHAIAMHFPEMIPDDVFTFVDQVRQADLKRGDFISVLYRKRWRMAKLVGFQGGQTRAIIEGDETAETRSFDYAQCRLVESNAEAAAVTA